MLKSKLSNGQSQGHWERKCRSRFPRIAQKQSTAFQFARSTIVRQVRDCHCVTAKKFGVDTELFQLEGAEVFVVFTEPRLHVNVVEVRVIRFQWRAPNCSTAAAVCRQRTSVSSPTTRTSTICSVLRGVTSGSPGRRVRWTRGCHTALFTTTKSRRVARQSRSVDDRHWTRCSARSVRR